MASSPLLSAAMLHFLAAYLLIVVTPGPIALATGSLASLQGFGRTVPLLLGIGAGTAFLAAAMGLGAVHLAGSFPVPVVKIVGAVVLALVALRIARAAPPSHAAAGQSPRFQAGLFLGGFLLTVLSPQSASFFAVSFIGLTLPIRHLDEALSVAVVAAIIGAGWYGLVALTLSRQAIRAAVLRRHRAICRAAAAVLALMALSSALSAFPWE